METSGKKVIKSKVAQPAAGLFELSAGSMVRSLPLMPIVR
jgi:hypothetical protein